MLLQSVGVDYFLWMLMALVSVALTTKKESFFRDDCNPERLSQCVPQMQGFMDNKRMVFAISEEELDSICETLNSEIECVESYVNMCFTPENRNFYDRMREDSMGIIDDLCTKGAYRTEYFRHAQCLNGSSSDMNYCDKSYRLLFKESLTGVSPMTSEAEAEKLSLVRYCCAHSEFVTCIYEKVLQFCEADTVTFFQNFMYRSTVSFFQDHCTNYTVGSEWCSSSNRLTIGFLHFYGVFPLVILLLAVTSSIQHFKLETSLLGLNL